MNGITQNKNVNKGGGVNKVPKHECAFRAIQWIEAGCKNNSQKYRKFPLSHSLRFPGRNRQKKINSE